MSEYENQIDIEQTERDLIPNLEKLDFEKISLTNSLLVMDDTLILFDDDTTANAYGFIRDTLTLDQWMDKKKLPKEHLINIKKLLVETSNYRVIRENNTYFFSEGGWIDSNWGKAYSTKDISNQEETYTFNRVRDIDLISDKPNWYEYYVD